MTISDEDNDDDGLRIVFDPNPQLPADRRKAVRWVQYDAPLFVRVEPDEDGWGTEITKIVLVVDPNDMYLARDVTGHFLVYDEKFKPIKDLDRPTTSACAKTGDNERDLGLRSD